MIIRRGPAAGKTFGLRNAVDERRTQDDDRHVPAGLTYLLRSVVDDVELSKLHQAAFESDQLEVLPWRDRLEAHSLTWVQAFDAGRLVGFVNVAWDGGAHAFVLDAIVERERRHQGIGVELVRRAAGAYQEAGCAWLHVDFEPHLEAFYLGSCGFRATPAGLLRLLR